MKIKKAFVQRRSVYNFREDFEMNEIDFKTIFELARHSPSMYNTQGVRYIVTTDKEKQNTLKELCFGQHKILTASGVILVLGLKDFLDEEVIKKVYEPMLNLNMVDDDDYKAIISRLKHIKETITPEELEKEMYRNVFINVGMLISIISVLGFDTCPMHVYNTDKIRELFSIPDELEILFMLPVGKGVDKERPKGYRHLVGELVKFEKYE